MKKMISDTDFARSGGELVPNNAISQSEFQVVEKTECLSIDYIQNVQ